MVVEERTPRLRGRSAMPDHVFGDGRLRLVDAEFQQLTVDAGSAPQRVGAAYLTNEPPDLRRDHRPARPSPTLPGPVESKPLSMPADDGLGLDDYEGSHPAAPCPRQQDPEGVGA